MSPVAVGAQDPNERDLALLKAAVEHVMTMEYTRSPAVLADQLGFGDRPTAPSPRWREVLTAVGDSIGVPVRTG